MKKLLSVLLSVALLLTLPVIAQTTATAKTSGDYEYRVINDGTAVITSYRGSAKDLTIPSELDGHTVTSIDESAFHGCDELTSVTIPDSVKSIGDSAFFGCTGLTSVTIGKSVKSIGGYAFVSCISLNSITIPASVTTIKAYANGYVVGLTPSGSGYLPIRGFTICGYAGTSAETYAKKNNFTFIVLADTPTEPPTEPPTDALTVPPATVICGDADGDNDVTILDATRVQRWLADLCNMDGGEFNGAELTAAEVKAADTDGDGDVTIMDATAIQRYIAGLSANESIGNAA